MRGLLPVAFALALLAAAGAPAAATEPCTLHRLAELPVTMEGLQPLVHAAINGTDALFLADSGAFFNLLTPAAAEQFRLHLEPAPYGITVQGVGGVARAWLVTVDKFTIFDIDVHKVPFLVAGNDLGHGAVGLLGQNVFRIGDVEYDLANGAIRLMRPHGDCAKHALAYWAKEQPYSEIEIAFATAVSPHTTASASLNGSRIHVLFDTGSSTSVLSLAAARRAGVTPETPGVKSAGPWFGIGSSVGHSWTGPFASFRIGEEEIRNTRLRFADSTPPGVDMLIGADFFLSHRVYVASSQRKLYFTYNGGPVFNLSTVPARESPPSADAAPPAATQPGSAPAESAPPEPAPPVPASPESAAPASAAPASTPPAAAPAAAAAAPGAALDAGGYARRGSASAARRDYQHAIADLTRAIELAPAEAGYYYERGVAYWSSRQADRALADFGEAIRLKPDDVPALLARARLRYAHGDPEAGIAADLDAVDRFAPRESEVRLQLAGMYQNVHRYPASIAQYDRWIDSHHADDVRMPTALNQRCWARAMQGEGLELALADCNAAVRARPKESAFLDSRGMVYLRQGKFDKAIADYDVALALNPKSAWSLYGRGLAKQRRGETAAGQADLDAAIARDAGIAREAKERDIVP